MSMRPGTSVRSDRSITSSTSDADGGASVTEVMRFPSITMLAPSRTSPRSTSRTPLARTTVVVWSDMEWIPFSERAARTLGSG